MNYLVSGTTPRRMGNAHPNIVPYQVFPVADGHVIIAVGNDGQFSKLCRVLGGPTLADDPRLPQNNGPRRETASALCAHMIEPDLRVHPRRPAGEARSRGRAGRADQHDRQTCSPTRR